MKNKTYNMITKSAGYQSSDGKFHASLDDAQKHELKRLINPDKWKDIMPIWDEWFAQRVFENRDKVLDILSTTSTSKVRGRKINGATRTRKPKHIAAQNTLPLDTTEPPRAA